MFSDGFDPTKPGRQTIAGAPPGHDVRVLAEIASKLIGVPLVHVALDDTRAAVIADALAFFAPSCEVISFPAWDCLPYDRVSPHSDIASERLSALNRMHKPFKQPAVVLTTINALVQKTLPLEDLKSARLDISKGDTIPVEQIRKFLAINGYSNASTVREPGEFAIRGGILDLFPPGYEQPVRLDFFGDEVESIRVFDPNSQTTISTIDTFFLGPISEVLLTERTIAQFRSRYRDLFGTVTENDPLYTSVTAGRKFPGAEHWLGLFFPHLYSLFDYLPNAPLTLDYQGDEAIAARLQQIEDFYQARLSLYEAAKRSKSKDTNAALYKPATVSTLYLTPDEVETLLRSRAVAALSPFAKPEEGAFIDAQGKRGRDFVDARTKQTSIGKTNTGLYTELKAYADEQNSHNRHVAIACYSQGSADRIAAMLRTHNMTTSVVVKNVNELRKVDVKLIALIILGFEHGFIGPDLAIITEQDILGDRLVRPAKKRRVSKQFQIEISDLNPGDFVVHADHGIGRYEGLEAISVFNTAHDCVKLIYDGNDKLYVPVENLEILSRYGSAESGAVLDKLGGVGWQNRKARVKKRLKDMAEALIKIAAMRAVKRGELITVPEGTYQEFAARFPYAETDDQAKAIQEVLDDLSSGRPMDRLVCGDVGFGKTEVALRAAFAAIQAGLQVAVVVPTTLLARQHFNNFVNRFQGFPVRIGQLSRMVSTADAKLIKEGLKAGDVDVVVGTHALLGNEVGFRNLGLMVIDEEQHFGVKQKERLKELRAEVHVLTLTATPIPRTLQLALSGVRELSLIATPPLDRLAVRTFVLPYDPLVIRDAIMREHYRGGQSFYVCPRIEDLTLVANEIRELVPEIKMVVAHGRMTSAQLDDIMTAFDARQYDMLLATNIIESGLDIPNANTMIIHRADMFGLAQLYQLRGRVGRAKLRGYAYLTHAPNVMLSQTAQQRLEVIQTLDQLGAGFQLASHDMDIRGAGNMLGEEQSGQVREVGVELYQQMLEDAISTARNNGISDEAANDRWVPQINLGMSVLIPETYVTDLNVRLGLYRRLADLTEADMIESFAAEMIDRFGPLPPEVDNLLQTVAVKQLCRQAGVEKVDAGSKGAVVAFRKDKFAKPERLIAWITQQAGTIKVRPDQKLVLIRAWAEESDRLSGMKKTLAELAALAA